ncbi:hypothetical protein STEG23_033522 [Scotinomys teguina]
MFHFFLLHRGYWTLVCFSLMEMAGLLVKVLTQTIGISRPSVVCVLKELTSIMWLVGNVAPWLVFYILYNFFSFQLLNRKDKTTFEKLDYLMSKEDNYKRTRDYIRSLKMVPSIPYLGLRLSSVTPPPRNV